MIILAADTERDQEMIDKFQRAYENLKKRRSSSLGVQNGKTYDIAVSGNAQPEDIHEIQEKRKPGAQIGHKGYFRMTSRPAERLNIHRISTNVLNVIPR